MQIIKSVAVVIVDDDLQCLHNWVDYECHAEWNIVEFDAIFPFS